MNNELPAEGEASKCALSDIFFPLKPKGAKNVQLLPKEAHVFFQASKNKLQGINCSDVKGYYRIDGESLHRVLKCFKLLTCEP